MPITEDAINGDSRVPLKYYFLIAQQRTGTGALGSLLHQHDNVAFLGEIFHPYEYSSTSFANDISNRGNDLLDYARRSPKDLSRIWAEFIERQSSNFGKRKLLIDVKWNSLRMLDPAFHPPEANPYLFEVCDDNFGGILWLTRRNALRTFISAKVAIEVGEFHVISEPLEVPRVFVDPEELVQHLKHSQNVDSYLGELLSQLGQFTELDYSQLFSSTGRLSAIASVRLEQLFGLSVGSLASFKPSIFRQAPGRLSDLISNYSEVAEALSGSPYFWMLVEH